MKKNNLFKILTLTISCTLVAGFLSGCNGGGGNSDADTTYKIKFTNYDDSVLYETTAKKGTIPVYSGKAPTRPSTEQYKYRFSGWNPTLAAATQDQTYQAQYTNALQTYTITIEGQTPFSLPYGSLITEPARPEDKEAGEYWYSFVGWKVNDSERLWNFATDIVKSDVKLSPSYVQTTALVVKFLDYDGTVLDEHKTGKGQTPVFKGTKLPSRASTVDTCYTFDYWTPNLGPIQENTIYQPHFAESVRQYNIKFLNYDKSEITTIKVDYGTLPVYQGQEPARPSDEFYGYKFSGWTPELELVTGDATYTATYNTYLVDPAKVIINQYIDDGATPVYTDEFNVPNHSTYTVDSKYHSILAQGYDANDYELKASNIVDMYLIAGQSNAAGYSHINYLSEGKKDQYPETPHVTFYGEIDDRFISDINTRVKFGLGPSNSHFGAEVGMAKMIEKANPNSTSTIVKTAYGGSWLYDYKSDAVSQKYGNWCSPSMRGASSDPNITGKCYDAFIKNITNAAKYYKDNGNMVRLSGMIWIQGEQESGQANSSDYGKHLEALINDLRNDFSSIFDYNATTAPFVIGKISSTFAGGHLGVDNVRACEEAVAKKMTDVYALETYEICDPITKEPKQGCYDKYHFAADDMLLIGERAATLMGEKIVPEGTSGVNVLRKNVNGTTTFDLKFDTKQLGSYTIEYYFQDGDKYVKNDYVKVITATSENKFYVKDKVSCSTEMPSEITVKPDLPLGYEWKYNESLSVITGYVLKDGKLTLKVYYSAVDPYKVENTIYFDESYWKSRGLSGQVGNFSQTSSTGDSFNFSANSWVEYTKDGWGSFVTNGMHWDAYLKNDTPILGITKIEIHMWWNMISPQPEDVNVPYINVSTTNDPTFKNNVVKNRLSKGSGKAATTGEILTYEISGYPSYIKIDFGDDSNNAFFDCIMDFEITYCGKAPLPTPQRLVHNVNKSINNGVETYVASSMDGTDYSNFDGSYYYKNIYSDAIIISATIGFIDHETRAFSGICFSTGEKVDSSKPDDTPRNLRSVQFGLAKTGMYSSRNHCGYKGVDTSSDWVYKKLSTYLTTEGKLTVVLYKNTFYFYINDVSYSSYEINHSYCAEFEKDSQLMIGFWFANYFSVNRKTVVQSEIYGLEDVTKEINTNDVYKNLRDL